MTDHNCKENFKEFTATSSKPYHFVNSGLPNVYLAGIKSWACKKCEYQEADIPAIEGLLTAIAESLVKKPGVLTGQEVRFLRKELGKKSADFASLINKTPEHYSKLENGQLPLTEDTDKLVRLSYTMLSGNKKLMQSISDHAEEWLTSIHGTRNEKILAIRKPRQRAWLISRRAA